jgi:hypothetical protein
VRLRPDSYRLDSVTAQPWDRGCRGETAWPRGPSGTPTAGPPQSKRPSGPGAKSSTILKLAKHTATFPGSPWRAKRDYLTMPNSPFPSNVSQSVDGSAAPDPLGYKQQAAWLGCLVCVMVIAGGAVNAGFSRFVPAVPFMMGLLVLGRFIEKSWRSVLVSLSMSLSAVWVNVTMTTNTTLFPILGGSVELKSTGVLCPALTPYAVLGPEASCYDGKPLRSLVRGDRYTVSRVEVSHPDFGTRIRLFSQTSSGEIAIYSTGAGEEANVRLSDAVQAEWAESLSDLMAWPLFPIYLPMVLWKALFPSLHDP